MQINQKQINSLIDENGNPKKCPECFGTRKTPARRMDCRKCKGTGQATIEIKKEWVECLGCNGKQKIPINLSQEGYMLDDELVDCPNCRGKGKIQKYKVEQEIKLEKDGNPHNPLNYVLIKLKIISETETMQRVVVVR